MLKQNLMKNRRKTNDVETLGSGPNLMIRRRIAGNTSSWKIGCEVE